MKELRTGIIGIGKVTTLHAKALTSIPESDFVAVCSRDINKAREFGNTYNVKGYDQLEQMIINEKLDVLLVCTPHPYHKEPVLTAANHGVHVLVEKPLASTLDDCDIMIEHCEKANVNLGVISQRRYYPSVLRIKSAIEKGKIDEPVLGTVQIYGWRDKAYYDSDEWRGTWKMEGGGVLVNQAPHQLDLLQWFMGPVDELYGYWSNLNHPYIEVEDTALAVIKFKNGGLGNIIVSNSQKPGIYGKVHVHGKNGASVGVQTDGGAMFIAGMSEIQEPPYNDIWNVPGEEKLQEEFKQDDTEFFNTVQPMEFFHQLQIQDFLSNILEGSKHMIDGKEGRKTVELFSAIYRSQRDKKPVKFPLNPENKDDMDGRLI